MQVAAERVCLECASPLNRCGHNYFSLRRTNETEWQISTFACACGHCAEHVEAVTSLAGGADGVVSDRRARNAQRHNTFMLDTIFGIDEPIFMQRSFVKSRVPVLLLRQMLLVDDRDLFEPTMPSMPLAGYDRKSVLPSIFCSFAKTLAFVQTRNGQVLVHDRVLRRVEEIEQRHRIDVPAEVLTNGRACSIMLAALLRIVVAYDMKHEVRTNTRHRFTLDPHVQYYEFQLQLFADTHLDLLVGADVRGAYTDEALCEPMSEQTAMPPEMLDSAAPLHEIVRRSVYERCYPHPLRASSAGELADMTNATLSADLWTKASDNTRSLVSELIHNIESKTANHRCGGRNFSKMICEMFGYNLPARTFITNILEIHSLGNYPGVVFRPGVRARLAVRRSYSLDELQSEPWCAWCHYGETAPCPHPGCTTSKRQKLHRSHICQACQQFAKIQTKLYAAVREFNVYTISCHLIVDRMMRIDSEWMAYTNVVGLAADESRKFTDQMYASRNVTPAELVAKQTLQMQAIELAQQCNKSVQRLRKDYMFAELMCRMCNHARTKIICETWSGPQMPEDFLMAPRVRNYRPFEDKRLANMNACFAKLDNLGGRVWCDVFTLEYVDAVAQVMLNQTNDLVVSLLHLIGVSPGCYAAVQDLHRNSELRNMPDNSFKAACIELHSLFPVDFHVIHYLLRRICHHDQFRVMQLDQRVAIAQIKALRERHKLLPWQPLPPVDRLYFCEGDWRVYADVVEPLTSELVQKAIDDYDGDALCVTNAPFGTGPKGALYSYKTGKLHCTRPPSSSIAKKFERDGLMSDSEFFGEPGLRPTEADKRTAKSIRVAQQTHRECSAPLKFVSMIGKIVRIGSHLYTLCTTCGSLFVATSASMSNCGFTCGRHVQLSDPNCYTSLREVVTRHTHEVRVSTNASHKKNVVEPLVGEFTTSVRGEDKTHVSMRRELVPLCAPSNVRPKATPLEKMFCIGTPCFTEDKFRSNVDLLAWAAQLGNNTKPMRVISRIFGGDHAGVDVKAEASLTQQLESANNNLDALKRERRCVEVKSGAEWDESCKEMIEAYRVRDDIESKIRQADHVIEAATAALEAADSAKLAEKEGGLSLAEAARISEESIASGRCLRRVAIICAFCYARCERNGCFTRISVIDLDGQFVEPLWNKKIETRGRLELWLCDRDFNRVSYFLRERPLVMADDLWRELVEMNKRALERRLTTNHGKK